MSETITAPGQGSSVRDIYCTFDRARGAPGGEEIEHPQGFVWRRQMPDAGVSGLVAEVTNRVPPSALFSRDDAIGDQPVDPAHQIGPTRLPFGIALLVRLPRRPAG